MLIFALYIFSYFRTFRLTLFPVDEETGPFHIDHVLDEDGQYVQLKPHKFLYEGFLEGANLFLISFLFALKGLLLGLFSYDSKTVF